METKNIYLFVFDTKENFEKSKKHLGSEGSAFKRVICIEDEFEFDKEFEVIPENAHVFMVVHVFYTDSISGIKRFVASGIGKKYPHLGFMFISDGDGKEINKQMIDAELPYQTVYKYHQVQSNLEEEKVKVHTKKEIQQLTNNNSHKPEADSYLTLESNLFSYCDYAIITALEQTEMEKILPILTKKGEVKNEKYLIEYGHLTSNPQKKIVYASQPTTGMIDAAILATEIIVKFNPKFLIMPGVLGGKPDAVKIGDVVIATKVFTIDKGKTSEGSFQSEIESSNTTSASITKIIREKNKIIDYIKHEDDTRESRINIHFDPVSCVRQVISSEGYFEEKIVPVDRKAIALEMESYGISRACELANGGKTIPLIIKSAMDNTKDKVDDAKTYAAWTSAKVVKYILENDLI